MGAVPVALNFAWGSKYRVPAASQASHESVEARASAFGISERALAEHEMELLRTLLVALF